jgi:hypothetical protein
MQTIVTITFIAGNTERQMRFFRPYSAKSPTYRGAARMVAARFNAENDSCGLCPMIKPSDISVCRVEEAVYESR